MIRRRLRLSGVLFASVLALASPLQAQVVFDTFSYNDTGGATSVTASHTMSASSGGCMLIAGLGDAASDLVAGATFDSVSATLVDKQNTTPGSIYWVYLYALPAPHSGTHSVVLSSTGGSIHLAVAAVSYTGVNASKCGEASNKVGNTNDPFVSTLTTLSAGARVVEVYAGSSAMTDSTGYTRRVDDGAGGFFMVGDSGNQGSAGLVSLSLTGGGNKQSILVSIAPTTVPTFPSSALLGVFR